MSGTLLCLSLPYAPETGSPPGIWTQSFMLGHEGLSPTEPSSQLLRATISNGMQASLWLHEAFITSVVCKSYLLYALP